LAILAVSADDKVLRGRSWRHDAIYAEIAAKDLLFHRSMLELYLTVLGATLISTTRIAPSETSQEQIEWITMFLTAMATLLSMAIPWRLTKRYLHKLQDAVKTARANEHTKKP
jgi:hypothetical protein